MDLPDYKKIIDELSPTLFDLTLHFQGEPFLHPKLTDMIAYARSKKTRVTVSTNGHFLTEEITEKILASGLNRLIIAMDGTDRESYLRYRQGADFDRVIEGIKLLSSKKKKNKTRHPKIILQMLKLRSNEQQWKGFNQFAKGLGADASVLKTAQFYGFENGNELMPSVNESSRYILQQETNGNAYRIRNTLPNHCFRMWRSCVITWEGDVVPCCFDKNADHSPGNVLATSFHEIWRGKKYRNFRKRILDSRKSVDICTNCTEGIGISRFL
jgi:radical SAM protein with 4Fe4S-binding SPASM domain